MRCRACNKPLDPHEIYIDERSGTFETCCSVCKEIALASMGSAGYLSDERAILLSKKAAARYTRTIELLEKRT